MAALFYYFPGAFNLESSHSDKKNKTITEIVKKLWNNTSPINKEVTFQIN